MAELTKEDVMWFVAEALVEYDLTDVEFGWSQDKSRFGYARSIWDAKASRRIPSALFLSEPLFDALTDKDGVLNTILNEVAHLIAVAKTGRCGDHGSDWVAACGEVGIQPARCKDIDSIDIDAVGYKYMVECTGCGARHGFSRMGSNWRRHAIKPCYRCRKCKADFGDIVQNY